MDENSEQSQTKGILMGGKGRVLFELEDPFSIYMEKGMRLEGIGSKQLLRRIQLSQVISDIIVVWFDAVATFWTRFMFAINYTSSVASHILLPLHEQRSSSQKLPRTYTVPSSIWRQ